LAVAEPKEAQRKLERAGEFGDEGTELYTDKTLRTAEQSDRESEGSAR
jgi:hypothetical protein